MAKTATRHTTASHDPNRLGQEFKRRLTTSRPLLGGMVIEYLRPSLIKLYKQAGFDFIYIENEHTLFAPTQLCDFILSARDNGVPVIIKVPDLCRADVARLLEAGAVGIQLPRTESRQDLLTLIDLMKFPPHGSRAGAPCFGNVDYVMPDDGAAWIRGADAATVVVAHIETAKGFENAEEIITTPNLDMVYVGPYDFSIAMGCPGNYDDPRVKEPMHRILELCLTHQVAFGTTASGFDTAGQWIAQGCKFFEVVDEMTLILQGAKTVVETYTKLSTAGAGSQSR